MATTTIVAKGIERYDGARGTTHRVRFRDGGTRAGKPVTLTVRTLEEARRLRDLVVFCGHRKPTDEQLMAHGFVDLAGPTTTPYASMTVAQVCQAYLNHLAARKNRRPAPKTMETYLNHLRIRIAPFALGSMPATLVTPLDVEEWQDEVLAAGGCGANTVTLARSGVLGPAFRWATSPKSTTAGVPLLDRANPVAAAAALEWEPFRRAILRTPEEYALARRLARTIHYRWADLLDLEACTGMRVGEAAGLYATDLVARRHLLEVRRHVVNGVDLDGTKSGAGYEREVPIPERLTAVLAGRTGRLLPAPMGGAWSGSDGHMWRKLRAALAAEGLPVWLTHHSFRHGIATWWSSKGMAQVKVDLLLGHKIPKTKVNFRYVQLTDLDLAMAREAAAELTGMG
jgi:integrase